MGTSPDTAQHFPRGGLPGNFVRRGDWLHQDIGYDDRGGWLTSVPARELQVEQVPVFRQIDVSHQHASRAEPRARRLKGAADIAVSAQPDPLVIVRIAIRDQNAMQ